MLSISGAMTLSLNRPRAGGVSNPLSGEAEGIALYLNELSPIVYVKDTDDTPQLTETAAASFLTTVRTTAGWRFNASGLLEQVGSGTARFDHDFLTGEPLGLLAEPNRTNVCRWNRDLTNAVWTATNVTAANNQIGLDGVTNSASSITATANDGTILQAITLSSSARFQSAFVKRLVGSGALQMTMDGGATWTSVATSADWSRVSIPSQTIANPSVGFRILTSGDSFAVDLVQNENGNDITSPLPTTSGTTQRTAELHTFSLIGHPFDGSQGTVFVEAVTKATDTASRTIWDVTDGTVNNSISGSLQGSSRLRITAASSDSASIVVGAVTENEVFRHVSAWNSSGAQSAFSGLLGTADTSVTIPTGITGVAVGTRVTSGGAMNGWIRRLVLIPRVASATELKALSALGWRTSTAPNIAANDTRIEDSDFAATLTATPSSVSGVRTLSFGTQENAIPGWRRRFNTTARSLVIHLENLDLQTAAYNGRIVVYVNDTVFKTYNSPQNAETIYIPLDFSTPGARLVEVVMPYGASIAFKGVTVKDGDISAPTSRASLPRAVFYGDSRIQGFFATGVDTTWTDILCRAKGWQHLNLGFASSRIDHHPTAGIAMGATDPDVAFMMTDYNSRSAQTPLATFKTDYKDAITDFRTSHPSVKLYCITSTWVEAAKDADTIKIADYRSTIAEALTELADANNILIDGLTLAANNTSSFPDGLHPGDVGSAEIAAAVGAIATL